MEKKWASVAAVVCFALFYSVMDYVFNYQLWSYDFLWWHFNYMPLAGWNYLKLPLSAGIAFIVYLLLGKGEKG